MISTLIRCRPLVRFYDVVFRVIPSHPRGVYAASRGRVLLLVAPLHEATVFVGSQILAALDQSEAGNALKGLGREHEISSATL